MYASYAQAENTLSALKYTLKEKLQSNTSLNGVIFENEEGRQAIIYNKHAMCPNGTAFEILHIPFLKKEETSFPGQIELPTFLSAYQKGKEIGYKEGYSEGKLQLCNVVETRLDGLKEVNVRGLVDFIKQNR